MKTTLSHVAKAHYINMLHGHNIGNRGSPASGFCPTTFRLGATIAAATPCTLP